MYRFLLTPGWLGRIAAALALAVVMSLLGLWQLSRYEERSAVNARIDAAEDRTVPLPSALAPPAPGEPVGPAPPADSTWTTVTVTGRYDPDHEILVRGRTVDSRVGYEVLTPLVPPDGATVLINRGWVPPASGGAADRPEVPPAPTGQATVTGRIRPNENDAATVERLDGVLQTRRIHLPALARELPYPVYGAYLQLESQQPPADDGLTPVPVRRENAWMNAGYTAQWWIFAVLVLAGAGWLIRREAHRRAAADPGAPRAPADAAGQ